MTRMFWGALVAVLVSLAMIMTGPAANAGVGIVRVKSAKTISNSAVDHYVFTDTKTAVRVIADFKEHKKNSVKLVGFRMCFSSTDGGGEFLLPWLYDKSKTKKNVKEWKTRYYRSGACGKGAEHYYKVNRTFKAKPGKELFQIRVKHGIQKYEDALGYKR